MSRGQLPTTWAKVWGRSGERGLHLAQRAGDLGPDGVDVIVESLQGKDFELGLLVGQEAEDTGCCDESRHVWYRDQLSWMGVSTEGGESNSDGLIELYTELENGSMGSCWDEDDAMKERMGIDAEICLLVVMVEGGRSYGWL